MAFLRNGLVAEWGGVPADTQCWVPPRQPGVAMATSLSSCSSRAVREGPRDPNLCAAAGTHLPPSHSQGQ